MQTLSLAPGEHATFVDVDLTLPETLAVADGVAAVYTARRPAAQGPNEDAAAVIAAGPGAAVLVVADGCGGMAGGDQAARLAVECLRSAVLDALSGQHPLRGAILDGVEEANRRIQELRTGAGATLAVVQLEQRHARTYHVGDAQILMVGGRGKIKQLTTSHSPVGYAYSAGVLDERAALAHEDRHLVSNFLGAADMHLELGSQRLLAARDGVLVASDGLLDNLMLEEAVELLRRGSAADTAAQLAALARQRMAGGDEAAPSKPDDLTLIVFTRR
jgi:serine/threonine protein phosphatase PrpC